MASNKRDHSATQTREKLITAALSLYGSRSIDAVSLREISQAAGQKNPNALQYHFGNRDNLLQAIIDEHATRIGLLREVYLERAETGEWQPAEAAARCLVMPIVDYLSVNAEGENFVKVVSQIAAIYQNGLGAAERSPVRFPESAAFAAAFERALVTLPKAEKQRRLYLAVNTCFHSLADICRAGVEQPAKSPLAKQALMVEQLIGLLTAFFNAPSASAK